MNRFFGYNLFFFFLLSLLFHSVFPARIAPPSPSPSPPEFTVTDLSRNDTWHTFAKLTDAGRGTNFSGMAELKKYFHRFGYIDDDDDVSINTFTDTFDETLETAVVNYQKNLGLPVTGKLDSDTVTQIMSPRCGVSDDLHRNKYNNNKNEIDVSKHYAFFSGEPRWRKPATSSSPSPETMTLTYAFSNNHMIDYISYSDIRTVFRRSFSRWSSTIPVSFTEVDDYRKADIKIAFYDGDHGDGEAFDGVLGVLAHAFSPENGRVHFDKAETWSVDFKSSESNLAVDLESVATHEIGHILGLAHSSVKESIMYPSLGPRIKKVDLKIDDVMGVQTLYGSKPNFRYTPSMESDISSGTRIQTRTGTGGGRWVKRVISLVILLVGFLF